MISLSKLTSSHANKRILSISFHFHPTLFLLDLCTSVELFDRFSVNLVVLSYGCETWSLTVREEHKLRVLRRIFGPKRDRVTGGWRKLYNEELHNLYSSASIIRIIKSRRMRWAGHVARMGGKRNVYRLLVGK
jgi:hypothetical protein